MTFALESQLSVPFDDEIHLIVFQEAKQANSYTQQYIHLTVDPQI